MENYTQVRFSSFPVFFYCKKLDESNFCDWEQIARDRERFKISIKFFEKQYLKTFRFKMENNSSFLVIEFQGLKDKNNDFIIQELAFVGSKCKAVYFFSLPLDFCENEKNEKSNEWLSKNFHNLKKDQNGLPYVRLNKILRYHTNMYNTIYTSGLEKAEFLSKILNRPIFNCNDIAGFSFRKKNFRADIGSLCSHC